MRCTLCGSRLDSRGDLHVTSTGRGLTVRDHWAVAEEISDLHALWLRARWLASKPCRWVRSWRWRRRESAWYRNAVR